MRATFSKTLFTILVVVLLVLGAIAGYAAWRLNRNDGNYDAQREAAAQLKTLQESLRNTDLPQDSRDALNSDLSTQLEALNRTAVDEAQADSHATPTTRANAGKNLDDAAERLYALAGTPGIETDESAVLISISVSQWSSARLIDGSVSDLGNPDSAGSQSLSHMTGLSRGDSFEGSGLCPAVSEQESASASNSASASQAPDAQDSEELASLLKGLYRSTWAESYYQARSDVDGIPDSTTRLVGESSSIHDDQLRSLRAALGKSCSSIPQPKAAYSIEDHGEQNPAQVLADQAEYLAQQSLSVVKSDPAATGQATGPASWRAWGTTSLALNTALAARETSDVPALPGV